MGSPLGSLILLGLLLCLQGTKATFSLEVSPYSFTGDSILVKWSSDDHLLGDFVAIRSFPFNISDACPSPSPSYRSLLPNPPETSGSFSLETPPFVGNVSVAWYRPENGSGPEIFECAGEYFSILNQQEVEVYDGGAPWTGSSGHAVFFSYESQFEGELELKKEFLTGQSDSSIIADRATYELEQCDTGDALAFTHFTIEAWFKSVPFDGCCGTVISSPGMSFIIGDNARMRVDPFGNGDHRIESYPTTLLDNQWHHLAVSFNGSHFDFYIDGALFDRGNLSESTRNAFSSNFNASDADTRLFNARKFQVGSNMGFPSDKNDKWIDELRVWDYARTPSQILATKDRSLRPSEISPSLQVYYDFNLLPGEDPQLIKDRSGRGRDLTLGRDLIGSGGKQLFKRTSPQFIISELPLSEAPFLVTLERPINPATPPSKRVALPFKEVTLGDQVEKIRLLSFPEYPIVLKLTNDTPITEGPPFIVEGTELIIAMENTDEISGEGSFTYQMITSLGRVSAAGTVTVQVEKNIPPVAGMSGSALKCNGNQFGYSKDFVLPYHPTTKKSLPHTIEFWTFHYYSAVKERRGVYYSIGNSEVVGNWCGNSSYCGGRAQMQATDSTTELYSGWDYSSAMGFFSAPLDQYWGLWNHFAVVSQGEGGNLTLYLNGNEVGQVKDFGAQKVLEGLYLCHWPFYGKDVHLFVGLMDEFRVWDHARTWEQINENLNRVLTGDEPGLLVYYDFEEEEGQTSRATDKSGKGNDLVFGGCTPCKPGAQCNPATAPQTPCYYQGEVQTADENRKPVLFASAAPVGGRSSVLTSNANNSVSFTLAGASVSRETFEFVLVTPLQRGELRTVGGDLLSNTPNTVLPSTLVFSPQPNGGGPAYASFSYSTRQGATVTPIPVTVSFSVRCPPGSYAQSNQCLPCPPGFISQEFSLSDHCSICPNNTFQPLEGQNTCIACNQSTFMDGSNSTFCRDCKEVGFNPDYGCPPGNLNSSTSSTSIALMVVAAIVIGLCVFVLIVFIIYRNTPVVKAASPVFCYLILLGLIIGCSLVFFFVDIPTKEICIVRPWLVAISLGLVLGNLFIKTWRIHRIFGETSFSQRMVLIGNTKLLSLSFGMVLLECLIPLIWTAYDPPVPQQFTSGFSTYIECSSSNLSFQWAMIGLLAFLNFLLISYGSYLAFQTRKVSSAFRESKYIALCIYNILATGVIVLCVVYIREVGFFSAYFFRSIGTLFCCTFILLTLFGTKMYIIFFQKEKNTSAFLRTFKGAKASSSFSSPDHQTESSYQDEKVSGGALIKNDDDKLSSMFARKKWEKCHCILIKHERCIIWRIDADEASHEKEKEKNPRKKFKTESVVHFLHSAHVSGIDSGSSFEMEVLCDDETSFRMKLPSKEEFARWEAGFRSVCRYRSVKVKGDGTRESEISQPNDPKSKLEQAARDLGVGLTVIEN